MLQPKSNTGVKKVTVDEESKNAKPMTMQQINFYENNTQLRETLAL